MMDREMFSCLHAAGITYFKSRHNTMEAWCHYDNHLSFVLMHH